MAVPKKKQSKQRTRVQYSAYEKEQQIRLENQINIVTCPECGARIPERTACPECGKYRGNQILKVKAVSSGAKVIKA
ncbi:MAG TPA: 50S ribosomal protein L32 [Candidatus Gracilibacteria bacterium]|nr:50S ribosomal protein L32 [Candidatus Gracilibacteria bacterium]